MIMRAYPYTDCFFRRRRLGIRFAIALLATLWGQMVCAQARSSAMLGPRLLLVEKDDRTALFLPETHIGTPLQDDEYFRTVLRPAFSASSELLAERSVAPWWDRSFDSTVCSDEGAEEAALDEALTAAISKHPFVPSPLLRAVTSPDNIAALGRFIRFDRLFFDVHMRALGQVQLPAGAGSRSILMPNAQSGVLLAGAPRRVASVENTGTMLHAYCSLPPAQRAALIAATIAQNDALPEATKVKASDASLKAASYRSIDAQYRQVLSCMRASLHRESPAALDCGASQANQRTEPELSINRFMLVARGQTWVAGLARVMQRERLPFYALGAAHFPDGPAGPGLITMLRTAGYTVTLLEDRHALMAILARLPQLAPPSPDTELTMHTLAGGCRHDGLAYGCDWHDETVSFIILNPRSPDRQEIWSVCFQRDTQLGPQKWCTSGRRTAAAEPAADM
jgi:hypothetical protein